MDSISGNLSQLQATLAAGPQTATRARQRAEEFEATFLTVMLNTMTQNLGNDPLSGGEAEATYRTMLNEQMANSISRGGGIGLADHVYRELMTAQEIPQ